MTQEKKVKTSIYKCPHEGNNCKGHKHCHVLETTEALPGKITVLFQCPVQKNQKIPIIIGT